jgi:MFS transporter, Spinster family, sphingosine-1-phosphate transporter
MLIVIVAFNYADRLALGLVLQNIKTDLRLSDTQLGFLTGIAFALFYSVMGIPIARWADRGNRVAIIAITTALWSTAVALCGWAVSYTQLLLIRVGIAVGEAGCVPPAHSLIADYFTRAERPRAVSRYKIGPSLSGVIGYFVAGWLNQLYGWRMMFVILGLPGIALAVLSWLTLHEPRRSGPRAPQSDVSLMEVCTTLWGNRTFRHLLLCFSVIYFFQYGIMQWQPAFFIRSFGLRTGELGTWYALIYGVGGIVGTFAGGELASRYAANDEGLQLRTMAVTVSMMCPISGCIYLASAPYAAFVFVSLATLAGAAISGPLFATIQTLVPPNMRATSIAIILLFANFLGLGLGPLAAGALSDAFRPLAGEASLRYALLAMCPGYLWAGWHLWQASRTVTGDLPDRENRSS